MARKGSRRQSVADFVARPGFLALGVRLFKV
jgi:hypothetical protein